MNRQILPYLALAPNEDGVELDEALVALLDLLEVSPGASLGGAKAGHPAGHVHLGDGAPGGLDFEQPGRRSVRGAEGRPVGVRSLRHVGGQFCHGRGTWQ